ncbi:Phosphoribosyl 1,2-cyclic phosphodiesterase [Methylomagnum ishizawai]|uniref:Phosphoribosyl 1,2-cyclic phosphodiesterase n=1 Tax=Methylomagnum ishizawai TaxID=1760988 RepID=A0A1Y6D1N9_9GAMM|nr:MBL fold metallo-hydrolase [Methylomagnum ishizawai]SMF96848.1 Phosphoribosyl 1,2-cyclic phosphodiesterase [Methylomagnum ishizawai]
MPLADPPEPLYLLAACPDWNPPHPPGFKCLDRTLGTHPLAWILATRPAGLVLDGDAPESEGLELLAAIRHRPELDATRLFLLSRSPATRATAYALGADECLPKPCTPEQLTEAFHQHGRFELTFWGVRGTLPIPGPKTLKYGGNTSCVGLRIGGHRRFVFDAGTGLRMLSNHLMGTDGGRFDGRIFISHPHWDHFNSLPFFQPLYFPGNHIVLHGPPQGERSLRDLIDDQMDGIFFPITVGAFQAEVEYLDLWEGVHRFDGVRVEAKRLCHPGHCLAYRVDYQGRSVAYVTDNELGARGPDDTSLRELIGFLDGVDVLIHDCTYFDDEYPKRVNWGHSSIGQASRLAHAAGVRYFYLFHHDPDHSDADIERKLALAERHLHGLGSSTRCRIAGEGDSLRIDRLA